MGLLALPARRHGILTLGALLYFHHDYGSFASRQIAQDAPRPFGVASSRKTGRQEKTVCQPPRRTTDCGNCRIISLGTCTQRANDRISGHIGTCLAPGSELRAFSGHDSWLYRPRHCQRHRQVRAHRPKNRLHDVKHRNTRVFRSSCRSESWRPRARAAQRPSDSVVLLWGNLGITEHHSPDQASRCQTHCHHGKREIHPRSAGRCPPGCPR